MERLARWVLVYLWLVILYEIGMAIAYGSSHVGMVTALEVFIAPAVPVFVGLSVLVVRELVA